MRNLYLNFCTAYRLWSGDDFRLPHFLSTLGLLRPFSLRPRYFHFNLPGVSRHTGTEGLGRLLRISFKKGDQLQLVVEQRSAPAPDPLRLELFPSDDGLGAHLEVALDTCGQEERPSSITDAVIRVLVAATAPMTRTTFRLVFESTTSVSATLSELSRSALSSKELPRYLTETTTSCSADDQQLSLV